MRQSHISEHDGRDLLDRCNAAIPQAPQLADTPTGTPHVLRRHTAVLAAIASLGVTGAFVALAKRRSGDSLWRAANLITLSRAAAAAALAGQAARGQRQAGAWAALVLGCTASDWLDGPVARRGGATQLGAILDIEADSWLTLWAAVAAWRSGALSAWCVAAPLARYPIRACWAAHRTMGARRWQRVAGTMQMVALSGALAPWSVARAAATKLAPFAMFAQLAALAADLGGPE